MVTSVEIRLHNTVKFNCQGWHPTMDLKRIAKDTAKTLVSYLTYQAVQTVAAQLRETNPPLHMWFHSFSSEASIQDGELYLKKLMQANQDLALRVMTVRAHLAEEIADYMPEMIRAGVQQANMEHRRDYLERITSLEFSQQSDDVRRPASRDRGGDDLTSVKDFQSEGSSQPGDYSDRFLDDSGFRSQSSESSDDVNPESLDS